MHYLDQYKIHETGVDINGTEIPVQIYYEIVEGRIYPQHAIARGIDITALICLYDWHFYQAEILADLQEQYANDY